MSQTSSVRSAPSGAEQLQAAVQAFVRSFGLLVTKQTPCGQPVSPSYAHALMVLLGREQQHHSTTQAELAARLGIDKSSVARLCARLGAQGHATQQRAPRDGRSRLLALTPRGRRMATTLHAKSLERFRRILGALPARQRGPTLECLHALTQAVSTLQELPA